MEQNTADPCVTCKSSESSHKNLQIWQAPKGSYNSLYWYILDCCQFQSLSPSFLTFDYKIYKILDYLLFLRNPVYLKEHILQVTNIHSFFFNWAIQNWGCLETCINCVTKCLTAKVYSMEFQISSIFNLIFQIEFLPFILSFRKHIALIRL